MKKGKQQNLLDLFVKKVKKKNLPKRDAKRFSVEREVKKKLAEQTAKYQQEVKSIKAPLRKALLEKMGLSVGEIEKFDKKSK